MQIRHFCLISLFIIGLFFISCSNEGSPKNRVISLNNQWLLQKNNVSIDTVNFPFSLIDNLYKRQEIGDPNYEDDYQKISINPALYSLKREINIDPKSLEDNQVKLQLGSINGLAEISVNNTLILTSTSYYYHEAAILNPYLHAGVNTIEIKFKNGNSNHNHPNFQSGTKQNFAHANIGCVNTFQIIEASKLIYKKPFLNYASYKDKTLEAFWNIPLEAYDDLTITIEWEFNGTIYQEEKQIKKGQSLQSLYFPIKNPRYWFPYTHGDPYLYTGELRILHNGELLQKSALEFGVKHLKWKNNKNQIEFVLNGESINVFTIDYNKPNWYKWASIEEIRNYIKDIKRLGINCIRISGKEDYLRNDILQLFDKAGILVWQDLHINKLPKTWTLDAKLNMQRELISLCETYRNHPSILSLGGKSESNSDTTKNAGLIHYEVFEQVIPKIINTFSHLEYIPNASYVWNDNPNDFSTLSMSSLEFSDIWLRQKYKDPYENAWISKMPSEEIALKYYDHLFNTMGQPADLEAMIYYSELHQNFTIDSLLAKKRGLNPKTIYLPISYGESGPGIHPSITDHYGYKKAIFYTLLKQIQPLSIHKSVFNGTTSYLLNNFTDSIFNEDVILLIKNKKGIPMDTIKQFVKILPQQSKSILEWNEDHIPRRWKSDQAICLEYQYAKQIERIPLNFNTTSIPYPDFKYRVLNHSGNQSLEILSNSFIPFSKIKTSHLGYFSTNFVVLLPQDTLNIPFNSQDTTYPLSSKNVEVYNYYQSFE